MQIRETKGKRGPTKADSGAGFTLVEVMTMTVMAMLVLGVSIPVVGNIMESIKLRTSAEALAAEIQFAKMKAVTENATVTLTIDANSKTFQIEGQPTRYIDTKVSFSGTPPSSLAFDSRGRLTSGNTETIALLGSNGTVSTITINPSGRVSVN
jgi:Tfp pilus assembly protein FimT